jgi:hypothetical protein
VKVPKLCPLILLLKWAREFASEERKAMLSGLLVCAAEKMFLTVEPNLEFY